jgi:DNA-binding transcriptional LysR family regulator
VLPYARATLAAVTGIREAADEVTGLLRGHLTIGTVASISSPSVDLPGLLAAFHHQHPAVEITLVAAAPPEQLADALRSGRFDLAFLGLGGTELPGLALHMLVAEPLVAAVARNDPLTAETAIPLAALAEHTLISLAQGTGLRAVLDHAAATAGLTLQVSLEAGDPRLAADLAAQGLGVAIVPRSHTQRRGHDLHVLTITDPEMTGRIALAWRADGPTNPAAGALINQIRDTHQQQR